MADIRTEHVGFGIKGEPGAAGALGPQGPAGPSVVLSVKDPPFNASGAWNGTHGTGIDDTAAIQACINAAASAPTGSSVYFPPGNYRVTATLTIPSRITLTGAGRGFGTGNNAATYVGWDGASGAALFRGAQAGSTGNRDIVIENMTLYCGVALQSGSVGIDARDTGYGIYRNLSIRAFDKGMWIGDQTAGGGYYNSITDCEIIVNNTGVYGNVAPNATRIIGGRVKANNNFGVRLLGGVGSFLSSAFESNGVAVSFESGTAGCSVANSYFEGNTAGAILFDATTSSNVEVGNLFSNGSDFITDASTAGSNQSLSPSKPSFPATPVGFGGGANLIPNGDFEGNFSGSGTAIFPTGWSMSPSVPSGTSITLDTTTKRFGTRSMRLQVNNTSQRQLQNTINVTPGRRYALTFWTYTDMAGGFSVWLGDTAGDHNYYYSGAIATTGVWQQHSFSFVPTTSALVFAIHELLPTGNGSIYMDGLYLTYGVQALDARHDSLAENTRTVGPALTLTGGTTTIAPTHYVHKLTVSGTPTVTTITPPGNFDGGPVEFIPSGALAFATGGNVANAATIYAGVPFKAIYVAAEGLWYVVAPTSQVLPNGTFLQEASTTAVPTALVGLDTNNNVLVGTTTTGGVSGSTYVGDSSRPYAIITANTQAILQNSTSGFSYVAANGSSFYVGYNLLQFRRGAAAAFVQYEALTADTATQAITLQGQGAYASATGANRVPGDVVAEVLAPTNGGTTHGKARLRVAGADVLVATVDTASQVPYVKALGVEAGVVSTIAITGGTLTLGAVAAAASVLRFTGTLTSNMTVNVPAIPGATWTVHNATTGAFTLTIQPVGGTGSVATQGAIKTGYNDATGANFYI